MKAARQVTITTRFQEISYDWPTSVSEDRKGNVRVYQGLRQRAFHPRGEWTKYTVSVPNPPDPISKLFLE